jgi:asparagine synthase (glutamine-hydrolysing)
VRHWEDRLVEALRNEEEPFDCLMNLHRAIYLAAHDRGALVVMDGVDGDSLLLHPWWIRQRLWRDRAWRAAIRESLAQGGTIDRRHVWSMFFRSLRAALAPDWTRRLRGWLRYRGALKSAMKDTLMARDLVPRVQLEERLRRLDSYQIRSGSYRLLDVHIKSFEHPILAAGLERYGRVAGTFGVEPSHPLLDRRLVEFCLALPWQLQSQNGWTKFILRRSVKELLPPEVVWRGDKDHLGWVFNRVLLRDRSEEFRQLVHEQRHSLTHYIDMDRWSRAWHDYTVSGIESRAERVWCGVALAMWLRQQKAMGVTTA